MTPGDELLFLALGGSGEIGMNVNLYGCRGKWLMCDLGLDFQQMSQRLGLNFEEHFARELDSLSDLEADGLLKRSGNWCSKHSDRILRTSFTTVEFDGGSRRCLVAIVAG